ncbi:MAG TPA: pyrroline-5-carboxylate reductase [Membranihabitans sp.]|nr:pyrroline-5-carboxylate reductase [Membranihabitans sp.]
MKILVIGGGNMGQTYTQSFLRSHIASEENMMILEKSSEKAEQLAKLNLGTIHGSPDTCIEGADLIILAVKPQDSPQVFEQIRGLLAKDQIVLSIMAGVTVQTLKESLGLDKIIRAMPNLPSQISHGMTVFTSTDQVSREELVSVQNLLNTTGKTLYVSDESLLDSATAISGSGPAYVFYFMESMMEAAVKLGFTESQAELLSWQTFQGTVDLFHKNDFSCREWIQRVSSRGGTTEAALKTFEDEKIKSGIIKGAVAAFDRARELGKE